MVTRLLSGSYVSFSIQSATSNVFALFAAGAVITDWLNVQIVVRFFVNPFLKHLFQQSSIAVIPV